MEGKSTLAPPPASPGATGYQFFGSSEKASLVFEIGSAYTKIGFSGEGCPRHIFPTKLTTYDGTTVRTKSMNRIVDF